VLGETLAVRQNLGAESSRNENESTVYAGFCGAGKFCLTLGSFVSGVEFEKLMLKIITKDE